MGRGGLRAHAAIKDVGGSLVLVPFELELRQFLRLNS